MPGMFDDLIPQAAPATSGGGMFDDLVPKKPSVSPYSVAGLARTAAQAWFGGERLSRAAEAGLGGAAKSIVEGVNLPESALIPGYKEKVVEPVTKAIESVTPQPLPAKGLGEQIVNVGGQVLGAMPLELPAFAFGGVPLAAARGWNLAGDIAKEHGKEATTWEHARDAILEGGLRGFLGIIGGIPVGPITRGFMTGAGSGATALGENRDPNSAAVDAGINAILGMLGPSANPKLKSRLEQIRADAIEGRDVPGAFSKLDDMLRDPKVAKALAIAARDRGGIAPVQEEGQKRLAGPPPTDAEFREQEQLGGPPERPLLPAPEEPRAAKAQEPIEESKSRDLVPMPGGGGSKPPEEDIIDAEFREAPGDPHRQAALGGVVPESMGPRPGPQKLPPVPVTEPKEAGRRAAAEVATQLAWKDKGEAIARLFWEPGENLFKGISDVERADMMGRVMRGEELDPRTPEPIKKFFAEAQEQLDRQYVGENAAELEYEWRKNYWPLMWTDESRAEMASDTYARQGTRPGFTKPKVFTDPQEGLAYGLELKSTNPAVLGLLRVQAGEMAKSRIQAMRALETVGVAAPKAGLEHNGRLPIEYTGYVTRTVGGQQYLVHPQAATILERGLRIEQKSMAEALGLSKYGKAAKAGSALYDAWMAMRNVSIPTMLSLSGFHASHIAMIGWKQPLSALLTQSLQNRLSVSEFMDAVRGDIFAPGSGLGAYEKGGLASEHLAEPMESLSELDRAKQWLMLAGGFTPRQSGIYETRARENLRRLINDELPSLKQKFLREGTGPIERLWQVSPKIAREGIDTIFLAAEAIQGPMFREWIPDLKTAAYLNEAAIMLRAHPELLEHTPEATVALKEELRDIQKSTDNRFGMMAYDRVFMPRMLQRSLMATFLSVGWNFGFLREYMGGVIDAPKSVKNAVQSRLFGNQASAEEVSRRTVFGATYVLGSAMMGGLMTWIMSGELPKEWRDYVYPRTADGSRLNTMSFNREFGAAILHMVVPTEERGIAGLVGGTEQLVGNKLLSQFTGLGHILNNQDYFGRQVYDEHAPIWTQIEQQAAHLLGQSFMPISVSQIASGKVADPARTALALSGFGPAPAYVEEGETQGRIKEAFRTEVAPKRTPFGELERVDTERQLRQAFRQAEKTNDPQAIAAYKAARAEYAKKYPDHVGPGERDLKRKEALWGKPAGLQMFAQLAPTEQQSIMEKATPEDRAFLRFGLKKEIRSHWPEPDAEEFMRYSDDAQTAVLNAAPKKEKAHWLGMVRDSVRQAYLAQAGIPGAAP